MCPLINHELQGFLRETIKERAPNAIFALAVIAAVLCSAAWSTHSITDAVGRQAPSSDTMFYRLGTSRERLEEAFRHFVERVLHERWRGLARELPYLLIDETHEPYYGKKRSCWIHGYKAEKGSTGSFSFLAFALVGPTRRLIVNVVPLKRKESRIPHIVETITWLRKQGIKFRLVVMDRGYYDARIIRALEALGIRYLVRARLCKKMRYMLESVTSWTAIRYEISKTSVETTLVLGHDKHGDWALATNACPAQVWRLRQYYRKRWDIENIFKLCDGIRVPTNSRRIDAKLLCVLVSCVVYNAWQHSRLRAQGYTLRQSVRAALRVIEPQPAAEGPPPCDCATIA